MKKLLLPLLLLALGLPAALRADSSVLFNEIMYHPATTESNLEWIELRCALAVDVDISGWSIAGGVQYTFPTNSIAHGGGFVLVAINPTALSAAIGSTNIFGPFTGRLSNNGDKLQLVNNSGRVVDEVNYGVDGDWPVAPDGSGVSLAKRDRETASKPAENWTFSEQVGGTPGADNFPFVGGTPQDSKLLGIDATWKYEDSGTDLGTSWRDLAFNDSAWASRSSFTNKPVTVFNTGVDANTVPLATGSSDPHYLLTAAAQGTIGVGATVMNGNAAWLANDASSKWIGVVSDGATSISAGGYNFQTTFSLSGYLLNTVQLNILAAADNDVTNLFLNGVPTGFAYSGFTGYGGFTLNTGLMNGVNTLEFRTVNASAGPGGFRAVVTGTGLAPNPNSPPASGRSTYYFRKSFIFNGNPAFAALHLNPLVADGAVFYLNGAEIYRQNLPGGAISYSTPALSDVASPAFSGPVPVSASSLVLGQNVLAVEIHQAAGSADGPLAGAELFSTPLPSPQTLVAYNELSSSTNAEFWLELLNYGTNSLLLDGCKIYRDGDTNQNTLFTFPPASGSLTPGAYRALTNTTLGFLPVSGDKLYLYSANGAVVFDGVVVKKTPRARFPNGSGPWLHPSAATPGGPNSIAFHNEIVMNEIMYHHAHLPAPSPNLPPQGSPEQWIELFNKSASAVDLTGWQLNGDISYNFPIGKILAPGAYLVVARDSAALRATYPAVDIVGDWNGKLTAGNAITLNDPDGNPADQVRYFNAGRWPAFADGGGSSLELRNPNADNSKAEAWAASDESGKSSWQTYTYTMSAAIPSANGQPNVWNEFHMGLLADGECLIDDITVVENPTTAPVQMIANGNFESGQAGWRVLGTHGRSRVEVDPDNPANHVLHVIASGQQEHMHNHIEVSTINYRPINASAQYQITFRAKWIAGNNLFNTRLYFNRSPHTTVLTTPPLNGTPGAQNTRYETNIGPTFSQLQHRPVTPQPSDSVTVSVVAQDPQGVASCEVWWTTNGTSYSSAAMSAGAGGLYSGTIPAYAAGTVVQFYVRGVDGAATASLYPAGGPNSGALYAVADGQANLNLGHNMRLLLTPANVDLLYGVTPMATYGSTNCMSNDRLPCTVVYDENRPYYGVGIRFKGSERGRANTNRISFHLEFPPDDPFRGVHSYMLIDRSGAGDATANKQQEILIKHILLRAGDIPCTQPDLCRVIAPRARETSQAILSPRHEDEFVETAYENGGAGTMWELELIYYPNGGQTNQYGYKFVVQPGSNNDSVTGTDITDLGTEKEFYRYNFIIKNHRDVDDYSRFMTFARALGQPTQVDQQIRQVMDVNEWMRAWALVTLCAVGDTYTFGNNHNLFMFLRPSDSRFVAFPVDMDFSFNRGTTAALIGDQNISRVITNAPNLRLFYAHILDIINTSYNANYMAYWITHYTKFLPGQDFSSVSSFLSGRASYAISQINGAGGNAAFAISGTNVITTTNNLLTLTGSAPVQIKTIKINGVEYPLTWNSISGWTIRVPVLEASNSLQLVGYDVHGNPMPNFTTNITVNYTGPIEDPQGKVVIDEIMYNPQIPDSSFVELLNTSSRFTFNVSGWRLHGLDYTFPPGSILAPGAFLVLAKDSTAFATAFGASAPLFDVYNGNLQTNGETLTLIKPAPTTNDQDIVINKVRYESVPPWPAPASSGGYSLQLIDASQDNARVSNWGDGTAWRFASVTGNIGSASNQLGTNVFILLGSAGEAYIDDVSLVPLAGPFAGSNLVQNGDFEAPLAGTWVTPAGTTSSVATNTYAHSGSNSLHMITTAAGSLALNLHMSQALPLSTNIFCTLSFWYKPLSGSNTINVRTFPSSFINITVTNRPVFATPGSANSVAASLPPYPLLWINELQADNLNGITNSAGQHQPWLELYNSGTNDILLDGYSLANNYTNLTQWTFPPGTVITHGEFKVIFADADTGQSTPTELHTNFRLTSGTGALALSRINGGAPQILDYINYIGVTPGRSYGSFPDGQLLDRQEFFYVTPGAANNGTAAPLTVFINEWMASNTRTIADLSSGTPKYNDWFELYNPATNAVSISGYFLTDILSDKFQYQIPAGYSIPAGGHLLVWADGSPGQNSTNSADLHVNFQLSKSGEAIGLFAVDGTQIDAVTFGPQTSDVSEGRCPEGTTNTITMPVPTPRAANSCGTGNTAPVLAAIGDKYVHQGQTLSFTAHATDADVPAQTLTFTLDPGAPAGASISAGGNFTWSTVGVTAPSTHSLTVRVSDNGVPNLNDSETISVGVLVPLHFNTVSLSGTQLTLSWERAIGQTYVVEYKDDLNPGPWTTLSATQTTAGNNLTVSVSTSGPPAHRFYRVRPTP
jgi:hypothetical protein